MCSKSREIGFRLQEARVLFNLGSTALCVGDMDAAVRVTRVGWPDRFVEQGKPSELMALYGMDAASVVKRIEGDV